MKELLVPVGNMESLIIAIHAGADAVYLGGKKFGARAFATNFNDDEMIKAIKLCHLYGVKIYVTVNTLVYESELSDVFQYVKFLHINGVDAVIVQDIGLIKLIRKCLPNLEVHASTQCHNSNEDGIKYLESLGVSRVVVAREMSLDEIKSIKSNLEIEAFIHGALCICYSGECLFSSFVMGRSGNRGECAQNCRLKYKLMEDDKLVKTNGEYLLSTKELNTSYNFEEIMNSNIYSLKIEGRMKSPEYVGCVTKLYRKMINNYYKTKKCEPDKEILHDLKLIFNRDYTKGFINNEDSNDLMNIKTSNHLGDYIGDVIKVDNKYIHIRLKKDLSQGDGIRFINSEEGMICNFIYKKDGKLINKGEANSIILLDNKFDISVGDKVHKTLDINIKNKYLNIDEKKLLINMKFIGHIGNKMELILNDGENEVIKSYGKVDKAINAGLTKDKIYTQLNKLGNTPFKLDGFEIDIDDNIFINIKDINELRREAISELINIRENKKKEVIILKSEKNKDKKIDKNITLSILVRNEEQLKAAMDKKIARIYVTDNILYNKYKDNKNILYRTNRVKDNYKGASLVTNLGNLLNGGVGDYFLNVCNHETINEFSKYLDYITLSTELSDEEIGNIMKYGSYNNKVELIIKSYVELMITKYCPLKLLVNKDDRCHVCSNKHKYYLVDRNDKKYRILNDNKTHLTHILNYKELNKLDNINYYIKLGINNYRIELLDESYDDVIKIVGDFYENI